MEWEYLNQMDSNLLYLYAKGLSKKGTQSHFMELYSPVDSGDEERNEFERAILKKKTALYILWFVFRYVLECETLEQAEQMATIETMDKYKLGSLFQGKYIFFGICGTEYEVRLWKKDELELKIVLEILYNQYNFFEQLECYAKRTEGKGRRVRTRCLKALEFARTAMKNPQYAKMLEKYINNRTGAAS